MSNKARFVIHPKRAVSGGGLGTTPSLRSMIMGWEGEIAPLRFTMGTLSLRSSLRQPGLLFERWTHFYSILKSVQKNTRFTNTITRVTTQKDTLYRYK